MSNAKLVHETMSFCDSLFGRLPILEDNLQFDKLSQMPDIIEVNTCLADKKQSADLLHSDVFPIGCGENCAEIERVSRHID